VECEAVYGKHPGELFSLVSNLANRVAKGLMRKYSVILGEGKIQNGYELAMDDPVAEFLSRFFEISTCKRKMDHSELTGEIDHLSRDAAVDYLMVPERVKNVESQLAWAISKLADLEKNVHDLVKILREAAAPVTKVASWQPEEEQRYIS
jgi:hypothetical protein